ncbi:hypothetical protein [Nannocystis pusilla]|uniref:hypothetical protein n=1 Tax=Nannocystis pusilla TaxID=889268 RepID=UPI003B77F865
MVEGFGFTGCNAKVPNGWNVASSGAITMNDTYGVQESLTVRACRFFENSAEYGAAIHVSGSNNGGKNPDIYIEDSVFENNTATGEGGAIASYGRVHISDSSFVGNVARTGGALALSYGCTSESVCDITNTVIKKNHTTGASQYEGRRDLHRRLRHQLPQRPDRHQLRPRLRRVRGEHQLPGPAGGRADQRRRRSVEPLRLVL